MKIKCCFDVTHEYIKKNISCSFDVQDDNDISYEYINVEKVNNQDEYNNDFNVCTGFLKEDKNTIIPNANITFLINNNNNDILEKVTDGINGIINAERNHTDNVKYNSIIVEECKSDENGKFYAFIENGIYDIKINCGDFKTIQKNIKINDGIQGEHYYTINSLINKKIGKSTFKMNKSIAKMINLSLLNENKNFINGDLIISQNNKIVVYKKIDKYSMFALENGIYDIRIRNKNTNIKIIKNFEFNENDDFVEKLMKEFIMNDNIKLMEV